MRLSCPGCQTEYEVPDAALAGRVRTLRCANCSHQWEYGPLPATLQSADPAESDWPGAAPRSTPAEPPKQPQSIFSQPTAYEPLDPPARGTWPPLPEPATTRSYAPLTIAEPLTETSLAETSDEPAYTEPASQPAAPPPESFAETNTKPAAGNEERFAALVKTSRNEPDFTEPRPGVRAGLFTTIILLIGISAGIWTARFHIMQAWPPSTRLFDAINNIITHLPNAHH
jgi:predicted Zn finger-like uncharacterized protein